MRTTTHTLSAGAHGAPLVVFAHGLEDSWETWLPVVAELEPSWRMVALDLPWRSGNDYRWRGRRPGEWLADGLDQVGAVPDVLVAHSFGANAALELLCAFDPRPGRSAVLVCPLYRLPHRPVTWPMLDRSRITFVRHIRDGVRAKLGGRARSLDPEVLAAMMDLAVDRVGPAGFLTAFDQFVGSADLDLGNVELPTLVIAGDSDPAVSGESAAELAAAMPGAEVHIGPDYDHFCHVRHASGIADRIRRLAGAARSPTRTAGQLR